MSVYCVILLAVSLSAFAGATELQSCGRLDKIFPNVFELQDGSTFNKCAYNGQQCCSEILIQLLDQGFRVLVEKDEFNFTSGLAGAQSVIDGTRVKIDEVISGIRDDVLEPLLLSPISSPPSSFKEVVKSVIGDIEVVLNGKHVDLKASIAKYFRALALEYFDEAVDSYPLLRFVSFSTSQKQCGSQVLFNHIYTNTESASKLIDLLQNISVAVSVIKQLPPIFDKLLQNFLEFRFSDTCLDVFISNYLCPACRNQPFMCPGRCAEIVTGCISPLHQSIVQLDTSIQLSLSIVKSLIGTSDSVTDAVTISRIPDLYDDLVQTIKSLDFLTFSFILKVFGTCGIRLNFFGKRSINEIDSHAAINKRAFDIPDVGIDETFLKKLEKDFSSLGGDKLANATTAFCSPDFSVDFLGSKFQVTEFNGMCSYGLCNVGYYNDTFKKQDVADQCFNPAGQFDHDQLINQAKNQTYVLTELFSTTEIPKSLFSLFLPGETLPTTEFLKAPAPTKPTINPTTTCIAPTSSTVIEPSVTSTSDIPTTTSTSTSDIPTPTTTPCPVTITSERYNRQENKVVVRFASDDPDATFECELDGKGRVPCKRRIRYKELDEGEHIITIYATCITNGVRTTSSITSKFFV